MEISSGPSVQTQIEVIKKAEDVQEQTISKLISDSTKQLDQQRQTVQDTQKTSTSALTGLGTGLDIRA